MTYKHNHKCKAGAIDGLFLCPETFMPGKSRTLNISVFGNAQHDGHPWRLSEVQQSEAELEEELLESLRPFIRELIQDVKPFAIHS